VLPIRWRWIADKVSGQVAGHDRHGGHKTNAMRCTSGRWWSESTVCHMRIPICDGRGQIPMPCSHVAMSPWEVRQSGGRPPGSSPARIGEIVDNAASLLSRGRLTRRAVAESGRGRAH